MQERVSLAKLSYLREGKVRMEQIYLLHPSAPAHPSSLAKRDARAFEVDILAESDQMLKD